MWPHILYSFWKFGLEKQKSGYLYLCQGVCVCEWFVYQFEILPPGLNKENSFLEGLKNAFVEILSVNTV